MAFVFYSTIMDNKNGYKFFVYQAILTLSFGFLYTVKTEPFSVEPKIYKFIIFAIILALIALVLYLKYNTKSTTKNE